MFFTSREETRKVIEALQGMACAYSIVGPAKGVKPVSSCDCKYGGTNLMKGTETGNGCPELRSVVEILDVMTEREWEMLIKRIAARDAKKLRAQLKKANKKKPRKTAGK